jgi:hypothetical protein
MPRVRRFNMYSDKEKVAILLRCLMNAIMEHPELSYASEHKTDLIGIACQYRKSIQRKDFDLIKDMKIEDIINLFNEGWK